MKCELQHHGIDNSDRSRDGGHACDKLTRRAKFRLTRGANHFYKFARLTRQEGRIAIVTKRGMGCGGRGGIVRAMGLQGGINSVSGHRACRRAVLKRTVKSCGSDASMVGVKSFGGAKARPGRSASFREATGARKPDTPG